MKTRHLIGAALAGAHPGRCRPGDRGNGHGRAADPRAGWTGRPRAAHRGRGRLPGLLARVRPSLEQSLDRIDVAPLLQPALVRERLRRHVRRPVLALPDDEWLLRPERRQPVAHRRLYRLRRNPVPCPGALLVQLRRLDELLRRRPLHHALRLKWDSRPMTTTRVLLAVLAALIVFSTLGAVLAIVATSDDEPARTRVETTTR